ncbi:MAG: DUF4097 family beta strand repeat-containing protein [Candidatus Dormibacteria bacterium]
MAEWEIGDAETIQFEEPPTEVSVHLVAGELTISATSGPATLEVSRVIGPEVQVRLSGGRLEVWQRDPRLQHLGEQRVSASVALMVPAGCRAELNTVSAPILAQGLEEPLDLRTVSGDVTLERLLGAVSAHGVSGPLAARGLSGGFRGATVSGDLTLEAYAGPQVRLHSVSGEIVADLRQSLPDGDVKVESVSGKVYLRLAAEPSQEIRVESVSGRLTSAFPELRSKSGPGSRSLKGTLGEGRGRVRVNTVSGAVNLLAEESG